MRKKGDILMSSCFDLGEEPSRVLCNRLYDLAGLAWSLQKNRPIITKENDKRGIRTPAGRAHENTLD